MCELLGMTATVPTDITTNLKALARRGSGDSPHRDGWGVAYYHAASVQVFRDPVGIAESTLARALQDSPIQSQTLIAHIRHANVGDISLPNTHPFTRELWGQYWTFAHNGQLKDLTTQPGFYKPEGQTDSESVFCDLLNQVRNYFCRQTPHEELIAYIASACDRYRQFGPLNCLISNSEWLFAYCSTKLTCITQRLRSHHQSEESRATDNMVGSAPGDALATLVATEPLTEEQGWTPLTAGQWRLWKHGALLAEGHSGA